MISGLKGRYLKTNEESRVEVPVLGMTFKDDCLIGCFKKLKTQLTAEGLNLSISVSDNGEIFLRNHEVFINLDDL